MANDPAPPHLLSILREAVDALRSAGHDVIPSREIPGLYRVDDKPDMTAGELISLAWRLGLMDESAKVR